MLKQFKISIMMVWILLFTCACSEIIEESIEDEVVVINAPGDGTISTSFTQTFWWNEVEGALNYRLLIVYNSFDTLTGFRLDTLITKNRFTTTLKPATYQWRVEALNGSSRTKHPTTQNLRIDSASIQGQDLLLISPSHDSFSNTALVNFRWEPLSGATEYIFQLSATNNSIVLDSVVRGEARISYEMPDDAAYFWIVTGKRQNVLSNPSEKRKFTIDRNAPDSAKLLLPASGSHPASPVTLTWDAPADNDLDHYEIYIYRNTTATPFSNKYNPYSTKGDADPLKTSFVFNEGDPADRILWRIRVVDRANNKSNAEPLRSFTIQ